MSLFFRAGSGAQSQRTSLGEILTTSGIGMRQDYQGVIATPSTAPGVVAFGTAAQLLADIAAMLPLHNFRKNPDGTKTEIPVPGWLSDPEGRGYGFGDFIAKVVIDACYYGNSFAKKSQLDNLGYPTVLTTLDASTVSVQQDAYGGVTWKTQDQMIEGGVTGRMAHFRRYPRSGSYILGVNPVVQYSSAIGLALATQRFGAAWFAEGAHPSAILTTDQPIDQEQAATIKSRFTEAIRGRREPAVLGAGLKYEAIQASPDSSRLIDASKWSSAEAARVLGPGFPGLLGYPTGDSMTYSTVEQESLKALTYSVDPHLVALEVWLSTFLPRGQFVHFEREALLRIDARTRAEIDRISLGPIEPWSYANEVRKTRDLATVEWGDEKPAIKSPIADEPAGEVPSTSVPPTKPVTQES